MFWNVNSILGIFGITEHYIVYNLASIFEVSFFNIVGIIVMTMGHIISMVSLL